jgi:hypothetical protein
MENDPSTRGGGQDTEIYRRSTVKPNAAAAYSRTNCVFMDQRECSWEQPTAVSVWLTNSLLSAREIPDVAKLPQFVVPEQWGMANLFTARQMVSGLRTIYSPRLTAFEGVLAVF